MKRSIEDELKYEETKEFCQAMLGEIINHLATKYDMNRILKEDYKERLNINENN